MDDNLENLACISVKKNLRELQAKINVQHLEKKKAKMIEELAALKTKNKFKQEKVELLRENVQLVRSSVERSRKETKQKEEFISTLKDKISLTKTKYENENQLLQSQVDTMVKNDRETDEIYESLTRSKIRAARNNDLKLMKITHMMAICKVRDQERKNSTIKDITRRRFHQSMVSFAKFCVDNWKQQRDFKEMVLKRDQLKQRVEELRQRKEKVERERRVAPSSLTTPSTSEVPKNDSPTTLAVQRKSSFSALYEQIYGRKSKTTETQIPKVLPKLPLKSEIFKQSNPTVGFVAPTSKTTSSYFSNLAKVKQRNNDFRQFMKQKISNRGTFLIRQPIPATPTQAKLVDDTLINPTQLHFSPQVVSDSQESQSQPKSQSQSQPKCQPQSQPKSQPKSQPNSQSKSQPKSQLNLKTQPKFQPQSLPKSRPTSPISSTHFSTAPMNSQGSSYPSDTSNAKMTLLTVKDDRQNGETVKNQTLTFNEGKIDGIGSKRRKLDENVQVLDVQVLKPVQKTPDPGTSCVTSPDLPSEDSYIFANDDLLKTKEPTSSPILSFLSFNNESHDRSADLDISGLMEDDPEVTNFDVDAAEKPTASGFGMFGGPSSKTEESTKKRSLFSFL